MKKHRIDLLILLIILTTNSCSTEFLHTDADPIPAKPEFLVINEVASTGTFEFIELFNMSKQPIILTGSWMLQNSGKNTDQRVRPFYIPEGTSIAGHGYLLICPFEEKDAKSVLNNKHIPTEALCDISFSIGAPDTVELYYGTLLVDALTWDTEVNSYGRIIDGSPELHGNLIPTPGSSNRKEPIAPNTSGIVINEIGSKGQDFVELYNSGNKAVTFNENHWAISDIQKRISIPLSSEITLQPGEFYLIFTDSKPFNLRLGSSDTVFLWYKNNIIDFYSWSSHVDSIGRFPDGSTSWIPMEKSPGKPNTADKR